MAISFNTGATASANNAASVAITIPAGVNTGDLMVLGVAVFNEVSSAPTLSFSGGAGGWTLPAPLHDGSNPEAATTGTLYAYGYFYYRKATAGDPGATLTITETGSPSGTTWLAAALAAYPGASGTQPDVAGSVAANDVLTVTSPAETTATAGDWSVGMLLGGTNTAPVGGLPSTSREVVTSSAGITAGIWDSNGSAGAAGSSIGGVTVHGGNSAPGNTFAVFTIGLAPAGGTPHAATAALTVTPTFSAVRTRGKYRTGALTVTPSSSAARVRGKYRTGSLAVPPSFSATRTTAHVRTAALTVAPSFSAISAGGAFTPPVFTYPAYWTVAWVMADTRVAVSPAGAQAVTITSAAGGEPAATLYPPGPAVIYPSP